MLCWGSVVYGPMVCCDVCGACVCCRVMLCSSSLRPHQPLKQSCASSWRQLLLRWQHCRWEPIERRGWQQQHTGEFKALATCWAFGFGGGVSTCVPAHSSSGNLRIDLDTDRIFFDQSCNQPPPACTCAPPPPHTHTSCLICAVCMSICRRVMCVVCVIRCRPCRRRSRASSRSQRPLQTVRGADSVSRTRHTHNTDSQGATH